MKRAWIGLLALVACQPQAASLDSEEAKTAYALGHSLGGNLKPLELTDEELGALVAGIQEAARGGDARVELAAYRENVQQLMRRQASKAAAANRARDAEFLIAAAAREGAVKFGSGLIVVHRKEGTGASPAATDTVVVDYHGTFTDGSVFDSSVRRGEPARFELNRVIPCWTEGIQKLKVGGEATLICPPEIAYGAGGAPPRIPPGATLVFDVTLHEIAGGS